MVSNAAPRTTRENSWKKTNYKQDNTKLALALVLLMIGSVTLPSMIATNVVLDDSAENSFTANGTISDTDTTTLLSNLNANNPIDVMGVMDDSNRIHLIWIENASTPLLRYALIQISTGVDTILISTTQVGDNNSTSLSSPSMVVDSMGRAHIVWEVTDTEILYTLLDPSEDDLDERPLIDGSNAFEETDAQNGADDGLAGRNRDTEHGVDVDGDRFA